MNGLHYPVWHYLFRGGVLYVCPQFPSNSGLISSADQQFIKGIAIVMETK